MTGESTPSTQQEQTIKRVVAAIIGQRRNRIDPAAVAAARNNPERLERAFEPRMVNVINGSPNFAFAETTDPDPLGAAAAKRLPPVAREDQQFAFVRGVEITELPPGINASLGRVHVSQSVDLKPPAGGKPFTFGIGSGGQ
jgi:hypothetical protein